jgi:hypothetical protein
LFNRAAAATSAPFRRSPADARRAWRHRFRPGIHGGAVLCDFVRFHQSPLANNGPWFRSDDIPPNYDVGLPTVYLVWTAVVLILYPPAGGSRV